ncbi:MAG TPA: complex I NDUFA9 subunit family protein [Casimicrobiaceae bacterium]|nr:complex I NDUFA9 subunit family protein [Casimicrobiaceae bacterium]
MIPPTVLVLGGSGFVGRYIVAKLVASGRRVIVPTRRREAAKHLLLLPTVDVIEADIHDAATLRQLASGVTAVVNLVGILNETRTGDFQSVHVELTRKTVIACRETRVARLLHMSAINARPDGPSQYLRSKGEAEGVVATSDIAWTIFRPSVIFGREDSFLNMFARLERMHGERYDLCGPKVYTLRQLVAYAGELTARHRPILSLGPRLSKLQATMLEFLPGKLMSRDNLASMQLPSVCTGGFPVVFGFAPTPLEAIAPEYLAPVVRDRYAGFRAHGRR